MDKMINSICLWVMIIFMVAAALGVFGFGSGGFESGVGP